MTQAADQLSKEPAIMEKSTLLSRVTLFVERSRVWLALLLLALVAAAAFAQSAQKFFWWDELASYEVAQLPHASDVWSFFHAGLDTPSPVPTLIVQATLHFIGSNEVLARLPFTAGFLLSCLCIYGFMARRYSAGYALSALILPSLTGAFYYASELRTYGMTLGAVAFALYCWQDSDKPSPLRPLRILGIFVGLCFATLCHIFCLFSFIPFGIAQIVRDWRRGRIDFALWAALLLAPLPLAIEVPGFQAAHKLYAGSFWSKPNVSGILWSYSYSLGSIWMIAMIIVLLAYPALERRYASFREPAATSIAPKKNTGFDVSEWTILFVFGLQPFYAWPLSHLVGVYVPRYVLTLTLGIVMLLIAGLAEAFRRNRVAGVVLLFAFVISFYQDKHRMIASALHSHEPLAAALQQQPWIKALSSSALPVIAPNTPVYMQMRHYISPELQNRFYYTSETPAAIRLDEDPGNELSMELFSQRLSFLHVMKFADFAAQHPHFLIVVEHPLDPITDSGNLSVHLVGNYHADEQFGTSYFSVYEVDVLNDVPASH